MHPDTTLRAEGLQGRGKEMGETRRGPSTETHPGPLPRSALLPWWRLQPADTCLPRWECLPRGREAEQQLESIRPSSVCLSVCLSGASSAHPRVVEAGSMIHSLFLSLLPSQPRTQALEPAGHRPTISENEDFSGRQEGSPLEVKGASQREAGGKGSGRGGVGAETGAHFLQAGGARCLSC